MKVSIALCTYNGGKFLKEQLGSFLQQTQLPDELIICDDGSTDSTLSVLEEFTSKAPFKVSIYRNTPGLGAVRNFEKAIGLCSGDVIFLSDQDDIWVNEKIEAYIRFFNEHPGSLLVFSNGDLINETGSGIGSTLWEKWNFNKEMRDQWSDNEKAFDFLIRNDNKITGATVAIRSDLKNSIFPFSVPKGYWHDCWLGIYAAKNNGLFFIEESMIQYRIHKDQLVGIGNGTMINKDKVSVISKMKEYINGVLK